jgi:hypothetical protein
MLSYVAIVFGVAIPLALFEIWLDPFKAKGIGGFCFDESLWGRKLDIPVLSAVAGNCMVTPYHLTVFLAVVPALCGIAIWLVNRNTIRGTLAKLTFLLACQFGVMVTEDALWFTLNTAFRLHLPDALPRLLHGEVAWFPRWIDFWAFKLPDFYVYLPIAIVVLLAIEHFASNKAHPDHPSTLL